MNRFRFFAGLVITISMPLPLIMSNDAHGQDGRFEFELPNLGACEEGAFSTEEDFIAGFDTVDENRYVSDGDLLSLNERGGICARHFELLQAFEVDFRYDLGLDAVDVLSIDESLVAFSTDLDNFGRGAPFSDGDLLINQGAIIPNLALTYALMTVEPKIEVTHDMGLDAVHFVGEPGNILMFVEEIIGEDREEWLREPQSLSEKLQSNDVDIWFSIEGTVYQEEFPFWPDDAPVLLDGDVISATTGLVVTQNAALSPAVPGAGTRTNNERDYGLDALTSIREPGDPQATEDAMLFSTETSYSGTTTFTDGDVLKHGGMISIVINSVLNSNFETRDVSLDAVWMPL